MLPYRPNDRAQPSHVINVTQSFEIRIGHAAHPRGPEDPPLGRREIRIAADDAGSAASYARHD
jgi:hypothetical protein